VSLSKLIRLYIARRTSGDIKVATRGPAALSYVCP